MDDLFFAVFRNVYLKRKILDSISDQFIDFCEPHISNRRPYEQIQSLKWMLEKRLYNIIKDKVLSKSIIIIDSIDLLIKTCTDFETFKVLFENKKKQLECVNLIKRSIELDSVFALDSFLKLYQQEELLEKLKEEEENQKQQFSDSDGNNKEEELDEEIIKFKLNEKENINLWMMNLALELSKLHVAEYILNNCQLPKPEQEGLLFRGARFLSKFDSSSKPDAVLRFIIERMGVNLDLLVQNAKSSSMLPSINGITKIKSLNYRLSFLKNKFLKNNSQTNYYYDQLKDREKSTVTLDFLVYTLLFKYHKKGKPYHTKFINYLKETLPLDQEQQLSDSSNSNSNNNSIIETILEDHKSNCVLLYINYYFQKNQLEKIEPLLTTPENLLMLYNLSLKNFSIDGLKLFCKYLTTVKILKSHMERAIPLSSIKDIPIKSDKQVVDFILYISDNSEISVPWLSVFQIFQQCYPIEYYDKVKSIHIKRHNKSFNQFIQDYCNNQYFDILKSFFITSEQKNNQIDTNYLDLFFQLLSSPSNRIRQKVYFQNNNHEKLQDFNESIRVLEYLIDIHCNSGKKIFSSFLSFYDIIVDNFIPSSPLNPQSTVPQLAHPTLPISEPVQQSIKYYNLVQSSFKIQSFISNFRLDLLRPNENKSLENIFFLVNLELLLFNEPISLKSTPVSISYLSSLNDLYKIKYNKSRGNNSGGDHLFNIELIILIFKSIYNLEENQLSILYQDLSKLISDTKLSFNQKLGQLIIYLFNNQYFKLFDFKFIFKWIDHLVYNLNFSEDQVLIIVKSIYKSIYLIYNIAQNQNNSNNNNNHNNNNNSSNKQDNSSIINNEIVFPILPEVTNDNEEEDDEEEEQNFTIQQFIQQNQPSTTPLLPEQVTRNSNILYLKQLLSNLTRKLISFNYYNIFKYLYESGLYESKKLNDPLLEYLSIREPKSPIKVETNTGLNLKLCTGNFDNLEEDIEKCKKTPANGFSSNPSFSFFSYRISYDTLVSNAPVEKFVYVHNALYSKVVAPSKLLFDFVTRSRFDLFLYYSKNMESFSTALEEKALSYILNSGEYYFLKVLFKDHKYLFSKEYIVNSITSKMSNTNPFTSQSVHSQSVNIRISNALKNRLPFNIFKNSLINGHIIITKLVLKYFKELNSEFVVNKKLTNQIIEHDRMNSIRFLFQNNLLIDLDYLLKSNSLTTSYGVWKIEITELFVSLINNIILKQQKQKKPLQQSRNNDIMLIDNSSVGNNSNSNKRPSKKRNNLILDSLATRITPTPNNSINNNDEQPMKRQRIKINNSLRF